MTHVVLSVQRLTTFCQRAKGLLGLQAFPRNLDGMYFERCNAVHTIGMRFAIDVIFIDSRNKVVKIAREVPPQQALVGCLRARGVIELSAGGALPLMVGDTIEFIFV